ncbi:2-phospho-L-lactate guanylyltransferase [Agromyces sp. G08B096]|uniref:2-phospho-L-lactate guanylyltransferase n=1 Tax=Agromyces sp. G08B096 TaxID=3156399 RepID=A0AAU7W7Y1_9MICO
MTAATDRAAWTVVVPVKAPGRAKTRLAPHVPPAAREALAEAFAADAIDAALAADRVERVVVVGSGDAGDAGRAGPELDGPDRRARLEFVREGEPRGLTAAIALGIEHARATGAGDLAVLLGDVPSLRPGDLDDALDRAARHPLAFVPDADGTGTTLATALAGTAFAPRFGPDSAAEHERAGFVRLEASARLRRDVDTLAALEEAIGLGTGTHTAHVVAALADGTIG